MNTVRKLTGTTGGESPILDGSMRGALVALLNAAIGLATVSDWVDAEQAVYFALMVNPLVVFLFGVWDRFWKSREEAAKLERNYRAIVADDAARDDSLIEAKPPTVAEAMKRARLPQDSRITPAVSKKKQPRDAGGRFGSKRKK